MQRHWNIKVEGVVITNAGDEEHEDDDSIISQSDDRLYCPPTRGEDETLYGYKHKLPESDKDAASRIISTANHTKVLDMHLFEE